MAALIEEMTVPAHVPAERVFDFDIYQDPRLAEDAVEAYNALRRESPDIFYTPRQGGHWVVTRFEDVMKIMHSQDVFSAEKTVVPVPPPELAVPIPPLDMNDPEHRKYRVLLNQFLGPEAVRKLEQDSRRLAIDTINAVLPNGKCEFVTEVGMPIPILLFLKLVGMDESRYREFNHWTHIIVQQGASDLAEFQKTFQALKDYIAEVVDNRSRNLGDDAISMLLRAKVDGQPVSQDMVSKICILLFEAGTDTVTTAMSYITRYLADNPKVQRKLREQPALIPKAIDELLRRFSFTNVARMVATDVEFKGIQMKKGDMVWVSLASANNDEKSLSNPSEVNFERATVKHVVFNTGTHNCAGTHLAKLELRVYLEEWLARMPEFRVAPGYHPKFHGGPVMGMDRLDLVW